jgi:8-oxo-dGTP pyrophosphatase MutT (NUDIX family)
MGRVKPWRELSVETLLDCRVFSVERSLAEGPEDHAQHEFFRIASADFVQIVPVTGADEIVMVRQYRHGAGRLTLEVPGGLVDPGESPATTAARECLEETGYRAEALRSLGVTNPNPALFGNRLHSFYAPGARRVAQIQNTSTEHTEVELVPVARVPELLSDGTIDHALIAMTLWRYLFERGVSVGAVFNRDS